MVSAESVNISVTLTDVNSGAVIGQVSGNLEKLGMAGVSAGAKVKQGAKEAEAGMAGMLSATEQTRLAFENFGIRAPRAFISLIAQCKGAQVVLSSLSTAMVGLASIQLSGMIFDAAIKGAKELWSALTDLPKAAREYRDEVEKARTEDFGNSHSIETTRARIDEATEAMRRYNAAEQEVYAKSGQFWTFGYQYSRPGRNELNDLAAKKADAQRNLDKLQHQREAEQTHEQRLSDLDLKYAGNVGLSGRARRDATVAEAADRAHEERFYGNEQDRILGNPVAADAGADKEARAVAIARIKADAELGKGGAVKSLDDVARKHAQMMLETGRMERQAIADTLSGASRVRFEATGRVAEINSDPDLDPETRQRRRAAVMQEANQKAAQIDQEDADRRDAAAARQAKEAEALARGKTEQIERAGRETDRIEAQARVRGLSAEKQKTAAIQAELDERLQQYQDELSAQQISQDDFNRRSIAAEQQANAERAEAATEARKKMASDFERLFKGMEDPKKYFKELGDKAAGQAAAGIWQRFAPHGAQSSDVGGQSSGMFGGVLDHFGLGKKKTVDASAGHTGTHESAGAFSIASATIHVGSASFVGGSTASTSSASGSAPGISSGGTSLLAHGSTGGAGGFGGGVTNYPGGGGAGSPSGPGGPGVGGKIGAVANQGLAFANKIAGAAVGAGGADPASGGSGSAAQTLSSGGKGSSGSSSGADASSSGLPTGAGALQGGMGVYGASQGTGGVGGMIQGAMSGWAVGGIAGAIFGGIVGFNGSKEAARAYDLKTVRPRISNDQDGYKNGNMDFSSAYQDLQSLQTEAFGATSKMGPSGRAYRNEYIDPEIKQAMGRLSAMEKSGRSQYTATAASYDVGSDYIPGTGMAMVHQGERIVPSSQNERLTRAIESQGKMPVQAQSMGDVHLHVHAIDANGVSGFLDKYKHNILSATNAARGENSGGGYN